MDYVLDTDLRNLTAGGHEVRFDPQVFDLLAFLIANRDRVVDRKELVDAVWHGRVVSEATLTSRIKAAREAIGDNGVDQCLIRTVSKKGFRFLGEILGRVPPPSPAVAGPDPVPPAGPLARDNEPLAHVAPHRASIGVTAFVDLASVRTLHGGMADAMTQDIIVRLGKLRTLFVIAPGTMLALRDQGLDPRAASRLLDVDYVASGHVRQVGNRLSVQVSLSETMRGRVIWAEMFDRVLDDTFSVLQDIGDKIVSCIAGEIEASELNRAILKPPSSLNAWDAYHRGLWHTYRMTVPDNEQAQQFLEMAVHLDPKFARAFAALSFTHFQNAFQRWNDPGSARDQAVVETYAAAQHAVEADEHDPSARWALGRSLWLQNRIDEAIAELNEAVALSPSYSPGHYGVAFVQALTADPAKGVAAADEAIKLSPHDPMLFGVLSARAIGLARLGRFEEAAETALKAARRGNSSLQANAIAGYCLALAGRLDTAKKQLEIVRRMQPSFQMDDFLSAMQFSPETRDLFRRGTKRLS